MVGTSVGPVDTRLRKLPVSLRGPTCDLALRQDDPTQAASAPLSCALFSVFTPLSRHGGCA
ncbi:hypothetical protein FA95DRAFT_1554618 [Auriscalpium vulgare]|uniref:Uncharacterized protein n=1 Tax=Auriscalpium vulgare TaxID=40419 RepID=A0ACB8S531_9AGAM|nr:hypothetical protein FA95DRAFT_1554618 [Auriscalpium vulgare]